MTFFMHINSCELWCAQEPTLSIVFKLPACYIAHNRYHQASTMKTLPEMQTPTLTAEQRQHLQRFLSDTTIDKILNNNPWLQVLSLDGEGYEDDIGEEGVIALTAALSNNTVITRLKISFYDIRDTVAAALASNTTLTTLELQNCDISNVTLRR